MINAVNEQFSRFVSFAQAEMAAGRETSIATKGAIAAGDGTTLEERSISTKKNGDWVMKSLIRDQAAKDVNNEVRALFKKTIADMFGGERNIPDSVKTAMLLKDYDKGKPLTARRIIAVKNAIELLDRSNVFGADMDPNGELAEKAFAAGYTRLDFGKINTAVNLLVKATGMLPARALEEVVTKGSAANRAMNAGSLYMKDAASFLRGVNAHQHVATDDAWNKNLATGNASKESTAQLAEIAQNLAYKFNNLLNDAEQLLEAAKLPNSTLDALRAAVRAIAERMGQLSADIASGELTDRKEIHKQLFCHNGIFALDNMVQNIVVPLRDAAAQNPAVAEFRTYLRNYVSGVVKEQDDLSNTYKLAVARDMVPAARNMLAAAAANGGLATGKPVSIPKAIHDNIYELLSGNPFEAMKNVEGFCAFLEQHGDASLRFSDEQKADLKALIEKTMGGGPKAEKILSRLIDQFETSFFAEHLMKPDDIKDRKFSRPDFVVNHFKTHPEGLNAFVIGFKLDTDEDVKTVKNTIKREMVADLNKKLQDKNEKSMTGLSTGLMPQSIREYGVGYVTFHGAPIPTARLGTIFPQLGGESNTPERKGYAEFLETKFDAKHKKMRQMVSFACGMADGLGGTIDSLFEHGGEKSNILGAPRDNCTGNGTVVTSVGLRPDENYNIEIGDNGDVKITLTHFIQNKVVNLFGENGVYVPSFFSSESDAPVVAGAKIIATMTIRNASDAELGEGMPEFTIDNIIQEEMN